MENQLESYTSVDLGDSASEGEGHVLDLKLKSLILDTIHAIDMVHKLMNIQVHSVTEWEWQKQLR